MSTLPIPPTTQRQSWGGGGRSHLDDGHGAVTVPNRIAAGPGGQPARRALTATPRR